MLELYTSEPNGLFLKPLIALAEKRAAYTLRYFDAANFEQFADGFPSDLESSLQLEREGPLLLHDGTLISSSFFMLEYISEALPGISLLPADPYDAYRARAWGQYLGAQLGSIVPVLGAAKYLQPHLASLVPEVVDRRIAAIEPIERRTGWLAVRNGSYTPDYLKTVRERLGAPLARIESRTSRRAVARRSCLLDCRHRRLPDALRAPGSGGGVRQCTVHSVYLGISRSDRSARLGARGAAHGENAPPGAAVRAGYRSVALGVIGARRLLLSAITRLWRAPRP